MTRLIVLSLALLAGILVAAPAGAQGIPTHLPFLSLVDGILFPGVSEEVQIIEPRSRVLIDDALKGDRIIGLVTIRPGTTPNARGWRELFPVGMVCVIDDVSRYPDGRLFVVLRGVMKFRIEKETTERDYRTGDIDPLPEPLEDRDRPALRELRVRVDELARAVDPVVLPQMDDDLRINSLAFYMDLDRFERQSLLERDGVVARAHAILDLLTMKLAAPH